MTLRKLLNATGALIAAAALIVAVPLGLWVNVGWPLPTAIPTPERIQLALRSSIDPQLLVNVLAIIVWVAWAQLVVALTVEVVAVARGRVAARLSLLPGLQHTAARLVAAFAVAAATAAPLKAAPAIPLTPIATVEAVAYPQPLVVAQRSNPSPSGKLRSVHYTTQRFDTLWGIAEQTLGDGRRWQEIRSLNPDHVAADGSVDPGVTLNLPADATVAPEETSGHVTVEAGDSFWSIARDGLTRARDSVPDDAEITSYWRQVIDTNRDRLAPPHDPDVIYPGQVFELPPPPDGSQAPTSGPDGEGIVVVESGDSLWSIARQALSEAWDRSPTDSETSRLVQHLIDHNRLDDPDLIHPGDTLQMPPIPGDTAVTHSPPPETEDPSTDLEPEPAQPGQQADPAPDQPNDTEPDKTPTTAATTETVPDDTGSPQPTDRQTASTRDDPSGAVSEQDPTANHPADDVDDDAAGGLLPTGADVAGLGILAAGLVALIDRLRRIQFQHRRPATIPTPPPDSAAGVEATLRSAAALTGTELLDVALRALGRHVLSANTPAPHVAGVHISDSQLRVLLWTPNPHAPEGWVTEDNDASWVLPTGTDLTHLHLEADGTAAPYPTLVTAGYSDDGQLLVDLEFIGALAVTGSPDDVAATCHTIATELAASPLADVVEVICVGFGHDLAQLERIRVVDRLDPALLDELEAIAKLLDETPNKSLLEGRMGPGGDSWYPVVVIDPAATAPEGAHRLLAASMSGRSVAAVVGYPTNDRWRFHVEDDTVRIEPLGFTLSRRDFSPREQHEVESMIAAAKDLNGVPSHRMTSRFVTNPNGASHHISAPGKEAVLFAEEEPADPGNVEVRVLGAVSVEGTRLPGRRGVELCTYLALHRDGVEGDRLMEALWPDEAPDYKRLNRTVSDTRVNLGAGPDGEPYLSNTRTTGGVYRLSPHFGCDLTTFTELTAKAGQTDGDEEVGHLQAALELVTGTPFMGVTGGYAWVWAEGLYSFTVVAVDDAAHRLSQLALDQDAIDLATWAARQGLLATAACENCYRNLMRAAIAQDNQVALEVIFNELVAVVDEDDGPDAMTFLDPETLELYENHSRRHRRHREH